MMSMSSISLFAPLCALSLVLSACASGTVQPLDEITGDDGGRETGTDLPNPDPTFDDPEDDGEPGDDGASSTGRTDDDASDGGEDSDDSGDTGDVGTSTGGDEDTTGAVVGDETSTGVEDTLGESEGEATDTSDQGPPLDVSGWTLVQTDSPRELVLPPGTVLEPGMVLVVGRSANQADFEDFWGVTLGADALYVSGGGDFPTINGDETYTVRDADDLVVDGPTPALLLGENQQRDDAALPAGDGGAWSVSANPNDTATPGAADPSASAAGLAITEVSDVIGAGGYVYEFIELAYVVP